MSPSSAALAERAYRVMTPNYRPAPLAFARGEGPWLWTVDGQRYLDFAAGIAVCALGHGHAELAEAIGEQARALLHVSNLWMTEPGVALHERLVALSFADRVYFGNSGAEANEAALKIARRYMRLVRGEDRFEFIATTHSFHGRTWAAISATGQPKYHKGFDPLVPGFHHVPYGDLAAVEAKISDKTCAIFVEPLQGEGGIIVPPAGYLAGLRALCDQHGLLLIFDEVQTGVGRTGRWFAYEHEGVAPDIMTLAKGLGGGVPIGAMLCTEEVSKGFEPGAHASTFGGNPLASRAALTVLQVIERDDLCARAETLGARLRAGLAALGREIDGCLEARGLGLLCGLQVDTTKIDRAAVKDAAQARGLLVTLAGEDVIRFSPPLIIGEAHVDQALAILRESLLAVKKEAA
ncbi:MAG: acetylornithine transaminase [Myxococcales bacterium]|nr:acetylornithine transaminase [Myxococcales bacterium]